MISGNILNQHRHTEERGNNPPGEAKKEEKMGRCDLDDRCFLYPHTLAMSTVGSSNLVVASWEWAANVGSIIYTYTYICIYFVYDFYCSMKHKEVNIADVAFQRVSLIWYYNNQLIY